MKFPTFLAAALFAVVVLSIPFVSAVAVERDRDDRTRPGGTEQEQPPREETSAPEREQEESEEPRGSVVYDKNGVVVHVDEGPDSTTVTVSVNGTVASKVTHSGSGADDDENDNSGEDAGPGQDGEDGQDGDQNGEEDAPEEDDRGRTDRDRERDR